MQPRSRRAISYSDSGEYSPVQDASLNRSGALRSGSAWTRLLGHVGDPELRDANPDMLRYRVWHLPARLAAHARQRTLAISPDWSWAEAFLSPWRRTYP